ncbi:MAG: hypothetical protein ABIN58_04470 [candidate division WOR-3 bacterium]
MREELLQALEGLERPGVRLRTCLLLVPCSQLPRLGDIAASLLGDLEDIRDQALKSVPYGSAFVPLNAAHIGLWLDTISNRKTGQKRVLVAHLDLLLAGLVAAERAQVWRHIYQGMAYRQRLVSVAMPETSGHLIPNLDRWKQGGRCFVWA